MHVIIVIPVSYDYDVMKCMSSKYVRTVILQLSRIAILTSFLYRHKWRHSDVNFKITSVIRQKFYLWNSVYLTNFAEGKLPLQK